MLQLTISTNLLRGGTRGNGGKYAECGYGPLRHDHDYGVGASQGHVGGLHCLLSLFALAFIPVVTSHLVLQRGPLRFFCKVPEQSEKVVNNTIEKHLLYCLFAILRPPTIRRQ